MVAAKKESMEELWQSSLLDAGNAPYLEELYDDFIKDPKSIPEKWRQYFEQTLKGTKPSQEIARSDIEEAFKNLVRFPKSITSLTSSSKGPERTKVDLLHEQKQTRVRELIDAYRLLGHLHSDIDPLKLRQKPLVPELMLSYYHLTEADLETEFDVGSLPGNKYRKLKNIIEDLKSIYCGTIASEFMHIPDSPERAWVQEKVEELCSNRSLSKEFQQHIFERLVAAEGLEKYLGKKFPGAKRFSLEGCDSLIVAIDTLIQDGGEHGIKDFVIGMAHRGRLNVLVNILGKNPTALFDEFEGKTVDPKIESGDVKYHQGFSSNVKTKGGNVHLSLAYNPSHLEIVSPVACGSVRARQERRNDTERTQVLPIQIHGDAAFSGQGVIMETLNMSQTRGFGIGGSIHIIVNNQIGFTTSDPKDARSTLYCSDIGKMIEVPIFHVNADDPEAVFSVTLLALQYRFKFKKDVIIDLIGYRRFGHNEADEPSATQPMMYKVIRKMPTILEIYSKKLISQNALSSELSEAYVKKYRELLDARSASVVADLVNNHAHQEFSSDWTPYFTKDWRIEVKTSVDLPTLKALAEKMEALPKDFVLHPRVQKIIEERAKMTRGEIPMDWGYGEILAYATILYDGHPLRMSGQDCQRGTFFHRHAVLHNQNDGSTYTPLKQFEKGKTTFSIYDSLLSEEGVVGFEYGFSTTNPEQLVIWEAQFGDFANGAQVLIDQFISSGEQKWGRLSGLTLYLPHGYEGQGPEHSSARLERYLQLCDGNNMQVCVPTNPAQVFHMVRRQLLRPMRKPLIVMTPKSLLRHKLAVSKLEDLSEGHFFPVIPEIDPISEKGQGIRRIILCSGKIFYELLEHRREKEIKDIIIIRIEQLYPFPDQELQAVLKPYAAVQDVVWCQEEPQNQGAWYSTQHHLIASLFPDQRLRYVGRKPSAAPAVGYHHLHQEQQEALVKEALS